MKLNNLTWIHNASVIRTEFGCDDNNAIDIEKILETQDDFTLIYIEINDNISGLCIKDGKTKIIAGNSNLSKGRQRFTIAHELYLYFHDDGCYVCSKKINDDKNDICEREADLFASYFLAPFNSFRKLCDLYFAQNEDKIVSIIKLEHHYGLSHLAILTRLKKKDIYLMMNMKNIVKKVRYIYHYI